MKVSIFGIGYVGAVVAACLADSGHDVVAVDRFEPKVRCINRGRSPIVEKGLDEMIGRGVGSGKLRATADGRGAIMATDMSLICVGTPSEEDGGLDYKYIRAACEEIGEILKDKSDYHIVVMRSTVVPGTLREQVLPIIESRSGKKAGIDFGLGNNPEFLREGTAIEDYFHPTQIVVGALDRETGEKIMSLYDGIDAPRAIADVAVAEGVKYVSNAWRANKIAFANEMGNVLKAHGADSHKVMEIFFQDTRLNMGPGFMRPGFAFGGSCLPKDIKAIRTSANGRGLRTPLLDSLLDANEEQIRHAYRMILESDHRNVGLLGLTFKSGTDDLRGSPLVLLADRLLEHGYGLKIYDPCVLKSMKIDGANRDYIQKGIPHIFRCLVDTPEEMLAGSEVYILGNGTREFGAILDRAEKTALIIDLVRTYKPLEKRKAYLGICW